MEFSGHGSEFPCSASISSALSIPKLLQENPSLWQGFQGLLPSVSHQDHSLTHSCSSSSSQGSVSPFLQHLMQGLKSLRPHLQPPPFLCPLSFPSVFTRPWDEEQRQILHQGPKCSKISLFLWFF